MKSVLVLIAAVQCLCTSCADVPTKESRIRGAFFGSLVADALTLGSHYEYDAPTIKKAYGGTISRYMGPGEMMGGSTHGVGWGRRNYHPGQKAGDQTDYGEQTIVILEYLAQRKNKKDAIQLKDLIPHWRKRLEGDWGAWKDSQTKQTLQQLSQGAPMQKKQSWWWVECNGLETCRSTCCLRPGEGHGSGSSRRDVHTPKF